MPRDERELQVAYAQVPGLARPTPIVARPSTTHPTPTPLGVRGPTPGAGQSTVVLGLAIAWASLGRRVVILDLDPTEDLARLLHVGWSLRPGNGHTLAHALRMGEPLCPAPSLLPGISVGSLGRWPCGHPAELARAWRQADPARRATLTTGWGDADVVLVDLPAAAGMSALETLTSQRLCLAPVGEDLAPGKHDANIHLVTRWRDALPGADAWLQRCGYRMAPDDPRATPGDAWLRAALPDLRCPHGAWDLIDGRVGEDADHAFRLIARELEARGATRAS